LTHLPSFGTVRQCSIDLHVSSGMIGGCGMNSKSTR
jgi:hypothetical protein